jgi:transposase
MVRNAMKKGLPGDTLHAVLLTHGKPCPVSDLFGVRGRQLLARLALPDPWQATIEASLRPIDELEREITDCERELRRLGANQRYVPLLLTVPGIGWVLAYTIAAETGDINRFPSPRKLAGYTGLCPRVYQSGERGLHGPLAKQGSKHLRWALVDLLCTRTLHGASGSVTRVLHRSSGREACEREVCVVHAITRVGASDRPVRQTTAARRIAVPVRTPRVPTATETASA